MITTLNITISGDLKRILKTLAAIDHRTIEAEVLWLIEKETYNRKIDKDGGMGTDNLRVIYPPESLTVCYQTHEDDL